jgi:hypothetical protein
MTNIDSMTTRTTQNPTFIDRFNFHLAENLLGENRLEEFGMPSKKHDQPSNSLYWRSKIIALENSSKQQQLLLPDGKKPERLLFLDVTFDLILHDDDKSLHLTAQFGFFLCNESSSTSHYVRGGKLTLAQLEEHAQGVGIDLHSAPPQAMAGMIASALSNTAKATAKVRANHLDFSLYYSDVDESGVLTLDVEAKTSQFDALGVSLLVQPRHLHRDDSNKDEANTIESFDTWFEQVHARFLEQFRTDTERTKKLCTGPTTAPTSTDKKPTAAGQKPKRPAPQAYQYAKVSNKRRRKSKLLFAKQV